MGRGTQILRLACRRNNHEHGALQSLFERVRSLPAEDWSGPRLASLAGCSRSRLHRRCVKAFGRSPGGAGVARAHAGG
jgi:transcriptional regulator GlxA family with amidase domain